MSKTSSSWNQTVAVIRLQSGLMAIKNIILLSSYEYNEKRGRSLMTSLLPLIFLLLDLSSLFALLYFLFFLPPPSPCNFFVQRIKFHLRGLWERRPSDWPLPVQMLWIYGAFLPASWSGVGWRDGWWDGGKEMGGVGRGLKPACISWGLGIRWVPSEEVSGPGLPGWLGNWPPSDFHGLPCSLPACSPRTGPRPGLYPITSRLTFSCMVHQI